MFMAPRSHRPSAKFARIHFWYFCCFLGVVVCTWWCYRGWRSAPLVLVGFGRSGGWFIWLSRRSQHRRRAGLTFMDFATSASGSYLPRLFATLSTSLVVPCWRRHLVGWWALISSVVGLLVFLQRRGPRLHGGPVTAKDAPAGREQGGRVRARWWWGKESSDDG